MLLQSLGGGEGASALHPRRQKPGSKEEAGGRPETQPLLEAEHQRHDAADPDSANGHAKSTERALVDVLSSLSRVSADESP